MSELREDSIPHEARAVLELYANELREVRFPDLDYDVLAAGAEELREAQLEVECIEKALEQARGVVRERALVLTQKAQRAMSYARVFASEDPELSARIAEMDQLGRPAAGTPSEPGKKRGRPRKSSQDADLFGDDGKTAEEVAA